MTIEPGAVIEGFRIDGVLGRGSAGVVYEATQLSLGRRVALKLLNGENAGEPVFAERFQRAVRLQAAFHHPHAVPVYDAGESDRGLFIAMQLIAGPTLATLLDDGKLEAERAIRLLGEIAGALDAAHAAGLVHGSVGPQRVLIDAGDRAFLADFALRGSRSASVHDGPVTADQDRRAFADMLFSCLPAWATRSQGSEIPDTADALVAAASGAIRRRGSRRRASFRIGVVGLAVLVAVSVAGAFTATDDLTSASVTQPAPAVDPGAVALGSDLAPGDTRPIGCDGRPPTPNTSACTLVQTTLSGLTLAAPAAGVIRNWAVRGARGVLRLQVIRPLGAGVFARVYTSQFTEVPDEGVHTFPVDLEIARGDLVGVVLLPGASIGIRARGGTTTARWSGPLGVAARPPSVGAGDSFDHEILLRADYVPGGRRTLPPQLTGFAAALAPAGSVLVSRQVELEGGSTVRFELVRLPDRIVVDMFDGSVRVSRLDVPDADAGGSVNEFVQGDFADAPRSGGIIVADVRLTWSNPAQVLPIEHRYALRPTSIVFVD